LNAPASPIAALPGEAEQKVGVSDTEVTIGSCAALTGQLKERGALVVSGGNLYFNYINGQGGVNGRKIKLVSCDDKYSGEGAEECFYSCLKGKVFCGTLFEGSPQAARYVPKSEQAHMPMVGFSSGAEFIIKPVHRYVFQVRAPYVDEAAKQIDTLSNTLGLHKIAVVYQTDAYGAAVHEALNQALKANNATAVADIQLERLTHNIEPAIKKLKAAEPDAVILGVTGDTLPLLVQAGKQIGPHVQLIGFSNGADLVTKEAGKEADGMLITQVIPLLGSNAPTVQLYHKLLRQSGTSESTFSGFEGFLIAMTVVEGLKRSGKDLTRDGFVKALESIKDFDIGLGPKALLSFSAGSHCGLRSSVYWTAVQDGKVVLWSPKKK